MMRKRIERRSVLKGLGATLTLPFLEAMTPLAASSAETTSAPRRLMFLGQAYGVTQEIWFPKPGDVGTDYAFPSGVQPLERHRKHLSFLTNLSNPFPGAVHSGTANFLTSADPIADPSTAFKNSISCDQVAAEQLGMKTRLNSIELTCPDGGGHGPGLSLAWNSAGNPLPGYSLPLEAFHRIYGDGKTDVAALRQQLNDKKSILDTVGEGARSISSIVSKADREKLEEYFESIRYIERRLEKDESWLDQPLPKPAMDEPQDGLSTSDQIRVMFDLMIAAFQTDSTRVCSFRLPLAGLLAELDPGPIGTHQMSHYNSSAERQAVSARRDHATAELLAYLIDQLEAAQDVNGTSLLDHSLVAFGTNIRWVHTHGNVPLIVMGHGGGGVKQGQHLEYKSKETPLANLWLSMLQHVGVKNESFANSTGPLDDFITPA